MRKISIYSRSNLVVNLCSNHFLWKFAVISRISFTDRHIERSIQCKNDEDSVKASWRVFFFTVSLHSPVNLLSLTDYPFCISRIDNCRHGLKKLFLHGDHVRVITAVGVNRQKDAITSVSLEGAF